MARVVALSVGLVVCGCATLGCAATGAIRGAESSPRKFGNSNRGPASFHHGGLTDKLKPCNYDNPCVLNVGPEYENWDFVLLDTPLMNSTTKMTVSVTNGHANILIGPTSGQPWDTCCGDSANEKCDWETVTFVKYDGTCLDPNRQAYNMYLSLWNRNNIEDETITITFNDGVGPGPA